MSVVTKKALVAGTAIALPLGIVAAGAASANDAPAPLAGLNGVASAVSHTAGNTNVLHGITDLAAAKHVAPAQSEAPAAKTADAPAADPASAVATILDAAQNSPLAALVPQASGAHRADNSQSSLNAAQTQTSKGKHRMPKHKKADQPLDAVTGNLGGTIAKVADVSLVNSTLDGVTEQLGLGHTLTDALKPVTGNGGILSGLLNVKERTAIKDAHQGRHARPATSLVDDSALPHTGGDSGEIAMLLGAGLALTVGGARLVTRRRRTEV